MKLAVIGAGIVGSLIARELTRYDADVLLFEKEADIGWGVTKANSAIVHGGFHEVPGTDRARFCVEGNGLYEKISRELDVPFRRIGAYVVALSDDELPALQELYEQGIKNGVSGLEMHDRETVLAHEPKLNPSVVAGLWSPSVGITEPWSLAIAAVENAAANGLDLHVDEEVVSIDVKDGRVKRIITQRGEYEVDAVVNAAGLFADRIAEMVGLSEPVLFPRRGEYLLLDKKVGPLVSSVVFPTPNEMSKGTLVVPTIDGGILLGPTAEDLDAEEKEATETTHDGLHEAIDGARRLVPELNLSLVVKTFAGLRPETADRKFVVGRTAINGFFQAAGMRSPGLTAAPSVARFLARDIMAHDLNLVEKESFNPTRRGIRKLLDLPARERDALIEVDPLYGRVVCQCNQVTEGEIVEAIHRGAHTLDGVKFRTRAGFGRCQGGFCTDKILLILARELGVSPNDVTLRGEASMVLGRKVRP
ncbi:MAG: NAD(P)/FAD-dependent oxidoreductase [Candidatus Bipolaricaulota bacterium]|nr:NAD(P)/FAD-dependent oxidoreductase [Candidatus Bipolaricaulota bacterium]